MTRGSRNLMILGVATVGFSLVATGISLAIYHNSGDIYLDRSRPGFLPDNAEAEEEPEEGYNFPTDEKLDDKVIDEYLEALKAEKEALSKDGEAFRATALSDEALGIE